MMIANLLYRFLGNRLSPAGSNGRLSILIYHRILAGQDPLFPHEATTDTFDAQMSRLKAVFNVLPLSEAIARLKKEHCPPAPLASPSMMAMRTMPQSLYPFCSSMV